MFRRAWIITLAIAAIATAVAGAISYKMPLCTNLPGISRDRLILQFYDGRFRLFWFHAPEVPFRVEQRTITREFLVPIDPYDVSPDAETRLQTTVLAADLHVVPAQSLLPALPSGLAGPDPPEVGWEARVRIGNRRSVRDWGYGWWGSVYTEEQLTLFRTSWYAAGPLPLPPAHFVTSYFRVPVWLPSALMLCVPIRAALVAVRQRKRRRRNECVKCGYNLFGLPLPRCPECGTAAASE